MAKITKILTWVAVVSLLLVALAWGFVSTGGMGLVRLYREYLTQDLPDKKYSAQDFRDRGPREKLSGYYAGGDGAEVLIWTLSGLKKFRDQPGTSVYYYRDTCGAVRNLANGIGEGVVEEIIYFDIAQWSEEVGIGDYVWVKRVGEGDESKVIDKIFANSKKTFPLEAITLQQCEE